MWSIRITIVHSCPPARPETREYDPERPIRRGKPRAGTSLDVDGELLAEGQLHDGLFLPAAEEREQAAKNGDRDVQRVHAGWILAVPALRGRLNLDGLWAYPVRMREGRRGENTSDFNADEY